MGQQLPLVEAPANGLPILVISLSRSGGKLVRTLLDGHPQIRALPFEHWHTQRKCRIDQSAIQRFSTLDAREKLDTCGAAHAERKIRGLHDAETAAATMNAWLRAAEAAVTPANLFPALVDAYFAQVGIAGSGNVVVNHSGSLCLFPRVDIEMLFGPARHVLSVRDPRAVWVSGDALRTRRHTFDRARQMSEREDGASKYLRAFCEHYRVMLSEHASRPDVVALRFEDLVQSPEAVMRVLADRLDLVWDTRLLQPTQLGQPRRANSSFERSSGIDASAAEDWVSRIAADDRDYIERKLGDFIRFFDRRCDVMAVRALPQATPVT